MEARHDTLSSVRVYANNPLAGFGPATGDAFLRLAGEEPCRWEGAGGGTLQKGWTSSRLSWVGIACCLATTRIEGEEMEGQGPSGGSSTRP